MKTLFKQKVGPTTVLIQLKHAGVEVKPGEFTINLTHDDGRCHQAVLKDERESGR